MPFFRLGALLLLSFCWICSADAVGRMDIYKKRNQLLQKRYPYSTKQIERSGLYQQKVPIKIWNGRTLFQGSKSAAINTDDSYRNTPIRNPKVLDWQRSWNGQKSIQMQHGNVKNFSNIHKNFLASRFKDSAEIAPEVKHFRTLRKQLSLQELNRYQFLRNADSKGIPVRGAGSKESPRLKTSPE